MDILEPELIWVDKSCYRFCDAMAWSQGRELDSYQEESYDPDYNLDNEESCDASIEILPTTGNRYKHSFFVNSHFYKFIIGAKGTTLKRLSADTRTNIHVPRLGQSGGIVITATNKRDIVIARNRIDILIETSRFKLDFTHFVAISVNSDEIIENFKKFQEEVLKTSGKGVREITEEIFQKPGKLHVTLLVSVILDETDRKKVVQALETCKQEIILPALEENGPIAIEFRGVEIMNDDPREVKVLYIQVHDASGLLQKICDQILDYFINHGLTKDRHKKVKLHMTAMNTKFLKIDTEKYDEKLITFDAVNILKEHQNTYFGKMNFSTMHLLRRRTNSEDHFYQTTAEIKFT